MATDSRSKSTALLRAQKQRLQPLVDALDSLDSDQVAALRDLASTLERLTALLDKAEAESEANKKTGSRRA